MQKKTGGVYDRECFNMEGFRRSGIALNDR